MLARDDADHQEPDDLVLAEELAFETGREEAQAIAYATRNAVQPREEREPEPAGRRGRFSRR